MLAIYHIENLHHVQNPKHLDGGDFSSVVKMYFSITGTGTWGMSQKKTKEAHSASLP